MITISIMSLLEIHDNFILMFLICCPVFWISSISSMIIEPFPFHFEFECSVGPGKISIPFHIFCWDKLIYCSKDVLLK